MLASSHLLYVFSLGEGMVNSALRVSRMLKVEERALLQGLPASIGQLPFEEAVGNIMVGNAMAVPVLGSVLAMELRGLRQVAWAGAPRWRAGRGPEGLMDPDADDDRADVLPSLVSASIARARAIPARWDLGFSGAAPRPAVQLAPC